VVDRAVLFRFNEKQHSDKPDYGVIDEERYKGDSRANYPTIFHNERGDLSQ